MDRNTEQILIIYSVKGTQGDDLEAAKVAIGQFRKEDSSVRVRPHVFAVPSGAAPGATLGTELSEELKVSIGAIAFVDDLRPNIAYEIGFFHGRGRTVLLLTRERIDSVWMAISDLAGAALVTLGRSDIEAAINAYLSRLYVELGRVNPWPALAIPSPDTNLLARLEDLSSHNGYRKDGPFGPMLVVDSWGPLNIRLGWNLLPGAKFKIVLRAVGPGADYSIYFQVRFADRQGKRRRVWLGLTSRRRVAGLQSEERTLPAQSPTDQWSLLSAEFRELMRLGALLGSGPVEFLEQIRFRAGVSEETEATPIEIGYLSITGRDT